ncbi:MAG TPA: hypothetical protein DIT01_01985 [Lentisphaeria bacterium]|nr:hypothetical protein [Lentisphaeria bacterium]|tara:strand:- start:24443 stop:27997 length:3555 start_codon:yes stop_codon:yes gene_type:complete
MFHFASGEQVMRFFILITACLMLGLCSRSAGANENAVTITRLKPLHLETFLGNLQKPEACIVAGDAYGELGKDLQQRIENATGIKLPLVSERKAMAGLGRQGNIIALGQFGNNKLIKHFYFRWYLVVDGMQPGAGGYVLQTVHNPDNLGINLLIAGGSDRAGVAKAADRLMANIEKYGTTLPRLFEVEMGAGKAFVEERGKEALDPEREWPTYSQHAEEFLGEAAMLYVYTGDETYAALFKEHLIEWLERGDYYSATDDFFRPMVSWDLVEESPAFSDAERLWITNKLWEAINVMRPDWDTYVFSVKDRFEPRANHNARSAIGFYFAARYFWQYYGIAEMKQWLADVATFWKPQMTSFMAMEGTDQSIASLLPATAYALAENEASFLSRDILGRIADKPHMQNRSYYMIWGGYGPLWLNLAAHLYDEPEYLRSLLRRHGSMVVADYRFPKRTTRELGRSFWDGRLPPNIPSEATRSDWVKTMPLAQLFHEKVETHGPKNIPYDKAFDFLVFRDPDGQEKQYLHVNGQNGGSYSTDSGNAITEFYSHGRGWIGSGSWIMQTTRHLTSVAIVRNGESQPLPAFVKLERAESTPRWGITRTGYVDYNGTDWYRNIINVPNKWFLVIDEIAVKEPGDYLLESRWSLAACSAFDGDDILAANYGPNNKGKVHFRLTGTGWQNQYMSPRHYRDFLTSPLHPFPRTAADLSRSTYYRTEVARRWAGPLKEGDTHVFCNLFYVDESSKLLYDLQELATGGYLVKGEKESWVARVENDSKWVLEPLGDRKLQIRTKEAKPATPAPDLQPKWQETESARILSSAVMSGGNGALYAVGLADGRIRLRDENGKVTAEMKMPGRVYALCALDLDSDGSDEILAGSDTAGVHAFSATGSPLWTWKGHGTTRTVITEIRPADTTGDAQPEIVAVGVGWYVLDRQGKMIFKNEMETGGKSWDAVVPERVFTLAVGDLMGDGKDEIVGDYAGVGDSGGGRIVNVWDGKTQKYLWRHSRPPNRFCGSTLKTVLVADVDGDGKDEFAIASDAFRLQLGYYNNFGSERVRIWYCNVGSGANAMVGADLDGDGKVEIIVGTEMGQVQAFDGTPPSGLEPPALYAKEKLFNADVEQAVMALAARPVGAGQEIWTGTVNGKLFVLNGDGKIIGRGHLPGPIDHLAVAKHGAVLATTSGGEVALYGGR